MAKIFEDWKQKRTAQLDEEEPKEMTEEIVETEDVEEPVVEEEVMEEVPTEDITETEEESTKFELELVLNSQEDLDLAKEIISESFADADITFEFDEEEAEETLEEEVVEGPVDEEGVEEVVETDVIEEEPVMEEDVEEVEACNTKVAKKDKVKAKKKAMTYQEATSRTTLAPKNFKKDKKSSLKTKERYLVGNKVIEVMEIDANKDQITYFDAKENKKVSGSLKEIEKQIEETEKNRLDKIKETQSKINGYTL